MPGGVSAFEEIFDEFKSVTILSINPIDMEGKVKSDARDSNCRTQFWWAGIRILLTCIRSPNFRV